MFEIKFTDSAIKDLRWFNNSELKVILAGIELHHASAPATEARHRRPLDGSDSAPWELRMGRVRVFYDVDKKNAQIGIEAIGCRRSGRLADLPEKPRSSASKKPAAVKSGNGRLGNIVVRSDEDDELMTEGLDDFDREVELTKENRELMTFLERRARQKATISLQRARKRLDIEE
jgi:mRNA-degrading endonuclease RelE of RelBE toxin-antitoxin system